MRTLELLRVSLGVPMQITSAYRCPKHNAAVGEGKFVGAHTMGLAVDVAVSGQDAFKLVELAFEFGWTGIGLKQHGPMTGRYIHLDMVPVGNVDVPRPRLWTYS